MYVRTYLRVGIDPLGGLFKSSFHYSGLAFSVYHEENHRTSRFSSYLEREREREKYRNRIWNLEELGFVGVWEERKSRECCVRVLFFLDWHMVMVIKINMILRR